MSVRIRLQRHGKKGKPFYWIVAADQRSKRDGKYLEKLGTYNPNFNPPLVELNIDATVKWIQFGAQPSDTAKSIISKEGALLKNHLLNGVKKGALTDEEADKKFEDWLNEKNKKSEDKLFQIQKELSEKKKKELALEKEASEKRKLAAIAAAEEAAADEAPADEAAADEAPADEAAADEAAAEEAAADEAPADEAPADEAAADEAPAEEAPAEEAAAEEAAADEAPAEEAAAEEAAAEEAAADEAPAEEAAADEAPAEEATADEATADEEKKDECLMTIDELVLFGTISKPFSFRGQLIVYSNFNSISSNTVFVKIDDSYVPFKLVNSSLHKKNLFKFKLSGINDEEKAKSLLKKEVYIKKDELVKNEDSLDFLINFTLYNKKVFIGPIISTMSRIGQDLIVVDYKNKNVLIPFTEQLITNIDKEEQILEMDLPNGLLQI